MVWWVQTAKESSGDERAAAVASIDRCLRSRWRKGYALRQVLSAIALEHDELGGAYLHLNQLVQASSLLSRELQVPEWIFADMPNKIEIFDVNGDGYVDEKEARRIYKAWLKQKRIELGGQPEVEVPVRSVEDSGYTVVKELGRGGQGTMYLCTKRVWLTNRTYCIKFYDKGDENAGDIGELIAEYELMVSFNSDHVAKTYEVFQDSTHYYLVNEPYFGGDLTKLAKSAYDAKVRMGEAWWRDIFKQCLLGLDYLHEHGVMHCDIKEPNIMIAEKSYHRPRIVLIDFGLAAGFLGNRKGVCGTPGYIPPEVYQSGIWNPRGDVFSLGIAFFQLLSGLVPSKCGTVQGALQVPGGMGDFARAAETLPLPFDLFPRNMQGLPGLIQWMTDRVRNRRPRPFQALHSKWFRSTSDADLPLPSLQRLIGIAAGHQKQEELATQLEEANTLDDLRVVHSKFQNADMTGEGIVDAETAAQILVQHGVQPSLAKTCAESSGGAFAYAELTESAMLQKEGFTFHFLKDLFCKLDKDNSGYLSLDELRSLGKRGVFDCPDKHVDQLLAWMDKDGDGMVSLTEFTQAALEYGRVNRRSQVGARQSVLPWASSRPPPSGAASSSQQQGIMDRGGLAGHSLSGPPLDSAGSGAPAGAGRSSSRAYARAPELLEPLPAPMAAEALAETWRVLVAVLGARGLRSSYPGAQCNSYCVCNVQGAHPLTFQTEVAHGTGDPVWNFEQEIIGFMPGDSLEFAVVNLADPRQPVLGCATLYWEHFFPVGYSSPLTITSPGTGISGILSVRVAAVGEETSLSAPNAAWGEHATGMADYPHANMVMSPLSPLNTGTLSPVPLSTTSLSSAGLSPSSLLRAEGSAGLAGGATVSWGRCWTEERRPPAPVSVFSLPLPTAVATPVVSSLVPPVGAAGLGNLPSPMGSSQSFVLGSFGRQAPVIRV